MRHAANAASIATGAHIATSTPGFGQVPCLPHQQMVEMLDAGYSEHRIGGGLENGGAMFVVFATTDGTKLQSPEPEQLISET